MAKREKKREPKYIASRINNPMLNYKVYYLKPAEKIGYFILAYAAGGVIGLVFYANLFMTDGKATLATYISNIVIFSAVGIFASRLFLPMRADALCKKRQDTIRKQFREYLASLNSSFSTGANVITAFQNALNDMQSQYGENAYIAVEANEIVKQVNNNISVYDALRDFAARTGIEDIQDFSTVFDICYQKGGDMKRVVRNTYDLIGQKIAVNEEIETKLTSNKMQQNIMSVVPIVMIGFLRLSSSSFAESFAKPSGVLCMTLAAGVFIGAYLYGKKIVDIKG